MTEEAKETLKKNFDMKDLGKLCYFLWLEITQSSKRIIMHQKKYVLDLLRETGMTWANDVDTPMKMNLNSKMMMNNWYLIKLATRGC